MLNDVVFNLGQGGLGSVAPGTDYISGYLIYNDTPAAGMSASRPYLLTSIIQAENYGIFGDYSDETRATSTLICSAIGSAGDKVTIIIHEPTIDGLGKYVYIEYIVKSSDTDTPTLAASIASTINASTSGYTATPSSNSVIINARPSMGASLNSGTPLNVVYTGDVVVSVDDNFYGGVGSILIEYWYQLNEFFRMAPNATIYVAFYPVSDINTFASIHDMVSKTNGEIKQLMVTNSNDIESLEGNIATIQNVCLFLQSIQIPISVLFSCNLYDTTNLATLPNLRQQSAYYVSTVISSDQGGQGGWLNLTLAKAVSNIGACLGTVALAEVEQDIAWTKFNISNKKENEIVGFLNRQVWNSSNIAIYNQLNSYGYIFLRKFPSLAGSYWNDSHTNITLSSDYSYIERVRVISKAQRGAYGDLIPLLNGPVYFNNDGTLANTTVATYEGAPMNTLENMKKKGEISNYAVIVDTISNVQQDGVLNITVKIIGVGVARNIVVSLGYSKTI